MKIEDIAPIIRGLTFDKNSKSIVHAVPMLKDPDLSCCANEIHSSFKKTIRSLNIEGVGGFLIGDDFDDAKNQKSNAPEVFGRNAIIHNSICVVTGGAQGFGEGIVRGLIDYGAHVFIADINLDGATLLANELNQKKGRTVAFGLYCDVTDESSVETMVSNIVKKVGGIDTFISNAGILKAGSVKSLTKHDFELVTKVNYLGFFLCTKYVSKVMAMMNKYNQTTKTDIINIASKSALEGSNRNAAYAGSKFGSIGLTQSFAKELIEDGIKVNTVCPGNYFEGPLWSDPETGLFIQYLESGKVPGAKTVEDVKLFYENQIPMQRGCECEDLITAILYLIEQKYETGQALPVTGGQVMLN